MDGYEMDRRAVLQALGWAGLTQFLPKIQEGASEMRTGFVLEPEGGEHLVHFRDHGNIFIKIGSTTGSSELAIGTQQVMAGSGIPIHRHFKMDEAFLVLEGEGVAILGDDRHTLKKGASIFIPKNTWHGFENPDRDLLMQWVVAPAGLDGLFRETCSAPGAPPKQLTREQIRQLALSKYDTEFR